MLLLLLLVPVVLSLPTAGIAGVNTWFASRGCRGTSMSRRLGIMLVMPVVLTSGVIAARYMRMGNWRRV